MHQMLAAARKTVLHDSLTLALGEVDLDVVAQEMTVHAPAAGRTLLAQAGIRDEFVFAVPAGALLFGKGVDLTIV
jgi:hypothetical protein